MSTINPIWKFSRRVRNLVLVDPGLGGGLPGDDLLWLEPESDLLLGVLDGVGTVADVASDIDAAEMLVLALALVFLRRSKHTRSHHGWFLERKPMGWWHRGGHGRS